MYVLPVALILTAILVLPAPQGMFSDVGLAQVISNDSATCLNTCNRSAETAVQACASLGTESASCNQAAMATRESCVRGCVTVAPAVPVVTPAPVVTPTPVPPSTTVTPAPAPIVASPENESVTLPECSKTCASLGNTYGNTCLAAGRTRTQCQALYDAFVSTCKSVSCQMKTDVASPLILGEAMRCVTNCGGINGRYQYTLCRKSYDAASCAKLSDNAANHCLPVTCPSVVNSTRNVPTAELFDAILGRAASPTAQTPTPTVTNPNTPQSGQVPSPTRTTPQNPQSVGGQNPPVNQAPASPSGDVSGAQPQKLPTSPTAAPTQITVAPTQITSVLLGRSVFSAIVSFIGGLFGGTSGEPAASPAATPAATAEVCLNTPADVRMTAPVHSGSVMGEYYRSNGCPVAVANANEACRVAAEKVVADQVKTKCAQLCKRTGAKLCTPKPIVTNIVIKGCDLSPTTKVTNLAPSGDGAWAYADSGGTNGFCFAKSSTNGTGITADLNCNCGDGE